MQLDFFEFNMDNLRVVWYVGKHVQYMFDETIVNCNAWIRGFLLSKLQRDTCKIKSLEINSFPCSRRSQDFSIDAFQSFVSYLLVSPNVLGKWLFWKISKGLTKTSFDGVRFCIFINGKHWVFITEY